METGFAHVNGTKLNYEVQGAGHPLALLHGTSTDTRMWDDLIEAFSRSYRVIRHDMRGHGRSETPTDKTYLHAQDLNALLEYLSIERAHVLGLSSGGGAIIDFALRFPEKTGALVPVSATPSGFRKDSSTSSTREIDEAIVAAYGESGKRAATEILYEHPVFKPALQNPRCGARMKQYLDEADFWRMGRRDPGGHAEPPQIERLVVQHPSIEGF